MEPLRVESQLELPVYARQNNLYNLVTMQSDKFVCVRDKPRGNVGITSELSIIDMKNLTNPIQREIYADWAIVNPNSKIIAVKVRGILEILQIEGWQKIKHHTTLNKIEFMKWISSDIIALVTSTTVYHWTRIGSSTPTKFFERHQCLMGTQIVNYLVDEKNTMHLLIGIYLQDNQFFGNIQLYYPLYRRSQFCKGEVATFARFKIYGNPEPSNVLCYTDMTANGAQLHFLEVGYPTKGNKPFSKKIAEVILSTISRGKKDFPIALETSSKYDVVFLITKYGYIHVYDIETATFIYLKCFSQAMILVTVPLEGNDGILAVNKVGQVLSVTLDADKTFFYLEEVLLNSELAWKIAAKNKLPIVKDYFLEMFYELTDNNMIDEAAELVATAPNGIFHLKTVFQELVKPRDERTRTEYRRMRQERYVQVSEIEKYNNYIYRQRSMQPGSPWMMPAPHTSLEQNMPLYFNTIWSNSSWQYPMSAPEEFHQISRPNEPSQEESQRISRPDESDGIAGLEDSGRISRLEESGRISRPEEFGEISRPEESGEISRPEESGEISRPEESGEISRPEESGEISRLEKTDEQNGSQNRDAFLCSEPDPSRMNLMPKRSRLDQQNDTCVLQEFIQRLQKNEISFSSLQPDASSENSHAPNEISASEVQLEIPAPEVPVEISAPEARVQTSAPEALDEENGSKNRENIPVEVSGSGSQSERNFECEEINVSKSPLSEPEISYDIFVPEEASGILRQEVWCEEEELDYMLEQEELEEILREESVQATSAQVPDQQNTSQRCEAFLSTAFINDRPNERCFETYIKNTIKKSTREASNDSHVPQHREISLSHACRNESTSERISLPGPSSTNLSSKPTSDEISKSGTEISKSGTEISNSGTEISNSGTEISNSGSEISRSGSVEISRSGSVEISGAESDGISRVSGETVVSNETNVTLNSAVSECQSSEDVNPRGKVQNTEVQASVKREKIPVCCICITDIPCYVIMPCSHLCLCIVCKERYKESICPICRKKIVFTLKVFT